MWSAAAMPPLSLLRLPRSPRDLNGVAWLHVMESVEDPRDQGSQIFDSVSYAHHDHRRNADFPQVLLVLKIAVGRKDCAETGGGGRAKQYAIPQTKPILRVHSSDFEFRGARPRAQPAAIRRSERASCVTASFASS